MSLDNSPPLSNQDKYPEANSTLPECCGCSPGEPTCSSNTTTPPMVPDVSPTMSSISSFVPRPFPPPTLEGVPESYIIHKLHEFAPRYWDKPSTADCTIIVPIPHPVGRARRAPDMPLFTPEMPCPAQSQRQDPAGMGRRVTEPILTAVPRVSFKLHVDYLCSQSTFLRGLFAGANPLDLINASPACLDPTEKQSAKSSLPFSVPANRLPRVLPSSPSHSNIFLPVPDPTSFHLLVHWMYFGHTQFIDDCLDRGIVHLAGITKNAEYLGLPQQLLDYLRRWVKMPFYGEYSSDEESESESYYPSDDSMDVDEEPRRGRTQTTRHLTHLSNAETSSH